VRFSLHRRAQSRAAGSARAPRPPGRLIPSRAARHALWPPHGPVPAGMLADKTPDQGGNPQPDRARFRHRLHGGARMAPQVRRSQPRASALAGLLLLPVGYCLGGAAQWRWWGGGGNGAGRANCWFSGEEGKPIAARLALVSRKVCSRPNVAPSASDLRQAGVNNNAATARPAALMGPR